MMVNTPRQSVDEPLVAQRVITSPHSWGLYLSSKLVVQRVWEIDETRKICYSALKPKNPARRQAEKGSSVRLEVISLLYGILADDEITALVMDAARAADIPNPYIAKLRVELELRLVEYRMQEQYGSLDEWDCDTS